LKKKFVHGRCHRFTRLYNSMLPPLLAQGLTQPSLVFQLLGTPFAVGEAGFNFAQFLI
jgi:hypothetical protein